MIVEDTDTARLRLRRPRPEDASAIFHSYAQDPEVTRYLTWRPHRSVDDTERFIQECISCWDGGARCPWVIERLEDIALVGMIDARLRGPGVTVGYVIAPAEWGKGYATEALSAVTDRILELPGIFRVWGVCDVENTASARVMHKAGMIREGILRRYIIHPNISLEPRDVYCYAKVR